MVLFNCELCELPQLDSASNRADSNVCQCVDSDWDEPYYKINCSDCGALALHHVNYGFIFCEGCAK